MILLFEELYNEIKHGDEQHQQWLYSKMEEFDKGEPLTKENIESLGWKLYLTLWWRIDKWHLKKNGDDSIWIQELISDVGRDRYKGPCPTINHLKFLMNLLKIEPKGKGTD